MRLRTVNRLTLVAVTSTIVTTMLTGAGCNHAAPPEAQPMPPLKRVPVSTQPVTMPTTVATSLPSAVIATSEPMAAVTGISPATLPDTMPTTSPTTTQATAEPIAPAIHNAAAPTDRLVIQADNTLADRISGIAEMQFAGKVTDPNRWPLIWKHQAALLAACNSLSPNQPRYARLMADANAQLHDAKAEKDALGLAIIAQQLSNEPADDFIWNRDLDLHLADYQTATDRLKYLDGMIAASEVPVNVRAHAGYRKAQVMLDRGEDDGAARALTDALAICPSSLECLKLRYKLLPQDAPRLERCTQLLDLLRANPLQSQFSVELADLVAGSGLVQESLPWLNLAVQTLHREGNPGEHSMLNLAAELYIGDSKTDAFRLNKSLLKINPANTEAHFLDVLIAQRRGQGSPGPGTAAGRQCHI